MPPLEIPPRTIEDRGAASPPLRFRQGAHAPYGIRWYGITSLYGHFRNFISRAIAAEDVDSRDWMRPESRERMLSQVLKALGAKEAPSLTEALERPVYIDFAADTGDDRDTSFAVGAMLAQSYDVPADDGGRRTLPRGDILMMGGDVAYPVATADEIHRRLTQPWNEALRAVRVRGRTQKRVLLGVPGNHDWYDGLDGFGRLFRKGVDLPTRRDVQRRRPTLLDSIAKLGTPLREAGRNRKVGLVVRQLHLDEVSGFFRILSSVAKSVRAFFAGATKKRRRRLVLHGYVALQEASYFAFPLTKDMDLWGVDRQLGRMDFRQRAFFQTYRKANPGRRLMFLASDPATAYGEPNEPGLGLLGACKLSLDKDELLYLTGDFHHYERRRFNKAMHVIAGGGGAFLHGTRISASPSGPCDAEYPPREVSRRLVAQVPVTLMLGRAGYLVHLAAGLVAALELWARDRGSATFWSASALVSLVVGLVLYLIANHRRAHRLQILAVTLPFAVALAALPMALSLLAPHVIPSLAGDTAVIVANAIVGSFVFGLFLMTVAIFGFEHQQAFTVLGHSGFKHFVRMCVHPDGRVEGWAIGKDDPLAEGPAVVVDRWVWSPGSMSDK